MTYASDQQTAHRILFVEAEPWERQAVKELCGCDCKVFDRPEKFQDLDDELIPENVTVLSTFIHSRVGEDQIDRLANLKLIATRSTGYDHIDLRACRKRGIAVANVPTYGDNTVAEHAFALLLALTRRVHRSYERTVRGDFSLDGLRGIDLQGKTLGVLGTGNIARNVLRIAGGFGMEKLAYDIKPDEQLAERLGFSYVNFEELLARSDVFSIHVPYNKHTHHMIDADAIGKMKQGAYLINTARGGIVDAEALIEGLAGGQLGGAGLDVLEAEGAIAEEAEILSREYDLSKLRSIVQNHALLRMPNVIITPHVGFNSEEAVRRIIATTVENIDRFLEGKPQNIVSEGQHAAG
ncbi:MAG: NAD(P)-dependent oxidoreductase [Phycisphaerae bacterium]